MNRYQINIEVYSNLNGKAARRRLYETACDARDAEIQAAIRIAKKYDDAEIISVYLTAA